MELHEINALRDSQHESLSKLGWYLYNRDTSNGLSKEELTEFVSLITHYVEQELEGEYERGLTDGQNGW